MLNNNTTIAILAWNARSALIQPSALANATALIGPRYAIKGVERFLKGGGAEAHAKSSVLAGREYEVAAVEVGKGVAAQLSGVKQKVGEKGLGGLRILDFGTARISWLGAYEKGLADGLGEKAARRYADDIVIKSQASATRSDRAPIQRTTPGQSFTTLNTFIINEWNMLNREIIGRKNKDLGNTEKIKRILNFFVASQVVTATYEGLGMRSPYPTPIRSYVRELEESGDPAAAAGQALLEMMEVVPVVGGGLRYADQPWGAVGETVLDAFDAARFKNSAAKNLETAGKVLGVPGTLQIKKFNKWLTEQE